METLDDLISYAKDARETKRALSVKMVRSGMPPQQISQFLNVSEQYISKWKGVYEQAGASGLHLGYQGRRAFLTPEERLAVGAWIKAHQTLRVEEVRDYLADQYGVLYQSKQSYYDLLAEGGMSYHHSEPVNPKRDEEQILQKREEIKKRGTTASRD